MFRNDLLKLSVTLVLLVATAFASVTAVAAAGSYTIIQVKAASASAALGGTADDWYARHPSPVKAGDAADLSDYFQRNPASIRSMQYFRLVAVNAVDLSDYFQRHPSSIFSGDVADSLMYYGPPGR